MIGFVTVFLSIVFLFCSLCCHDCLLYNFFLFAAALFRDTFEGLFWAFLVVKLAFLVVKLAFFVVKLAFFIQ